jgi:hypothetical protein
MSRFLTICALLIVAFATKASTAGLWHVVVESDSGSARKENAFTIT